MAYEKDKLKRVGTGSDAYSNVMHQGKLLSEWAKDLNFEFTLGELYRMASAGEDMHRFLLRHKGIISEA